MTAAFPALLHYLFAFYFWDEDTTDDIEVVCERGATDQARARLRGEVKMPRNLQFTESVELGLLEVSEDGQRALYCTLKTTGEQLMVIASDGAGGWKLLAREYDEVAARALLSRQADALPA